MYVAARNQRSRQTPATMKINPISENQSCSGTKHSSRMIPNATNPTANHLLKGERQHRLNDLNTSYTSLRYSRYREVSGGFAERARR